MCTALSLWVNFFQLISDLSVYSTGIQMITYIYIQIPHKKNFHSSTNMPGQKSVDFSLPPSQSHMGSCSMTCQAIQNHTQRPLIKAQYRIILAFPQIGYSLNVLTAEQTQLNVWFSQPSQMEWRLHRAWSVQQANIHGGSINQECASLSFNIIIPQV